jgi:hypothetical protein
MVWRFSVWSGLVSLLNGFQVVRMVELLGLLGFLDYIRGQGGLLSGVGGLFKLQNIKQ